MGDASKMKKGDKVDAAMAKGGKSSMPHPKAHPGEDWSDHKMTSKHTSKSMKTGRYA